MSTLEEMCERLRAMPDVMERCAEDVADVIEAELKRTIAAGTTPEGEAWKPTKKGKQPLSGFALTQDLYDALGIERWH